MQNARLRFNRFFTALTGIACGVAAYLFVCRWIPEENAPARRELPNGGIHFVLTPPREAALVPSFVTGSIAGLVISVFIQRRREPEPRRPSLILRWITYLLYFLLAGVLFFSTFIEPAVHYYAVTLDGDEIRLHTLYGTHAIPPPDVVATDITRAHSDRDEKVTYLTHSIRDLDGKTYRSRPITCNAAGREHPNVPAGETFLQDLNREIRKRRGPP